ncbi:MAG: hypothetical protein K2X93_05185 [Candidatus Obscuribacterales bacterium]|nr:hypothetical protein [Candidatus Obscuribacterales bacterium]
MFAPTTELEIVYKDSDFIAVNKPSGMIVHRGWDNDPITVADIVRDSIIEAPVFAVHRLDRGTSGVLLFALRSEVARYFQNQMADMKKRYLTLVRGPMKAGFRLDHPIPNKKDGPRVDAVTEFNPIAHHGRWTLVDAVPVTGRLHQIRRHLKHLSHPVVGDVRYGKGDVNRLFRDRFDLNRLALHCYQIELIAPCGEALVLNASLPDDLVVPFIRMGLCPTTMVDYQ